MEKVILSNEIKLKHPFAMLTAGPSQVGKTYWVRKFLENHEELCDTKFIRIIWAYGQYQELYSHEIKNGVNIEYYEGIDDDLKKSITGNEPTLLVLDDLMAEVCAEKKWSNIFTKGVHHLNLSCIFIVQNLLYQSKESRTISLNCHYFAIFPNKRDQKQISVFASQIAPGQVQKFKSIFCDATSNSYSPLFIDIHPKGHHLLKFRSNIFAERNEPAIIYL